MEGEIAAGRLEIVHDNFRNLGAILASSKILKERCARWDLELKKKFVLFSVRAVTQPFLQGLDGILIDLGVSSHQLDDPSRGVSYLRGEQACAAPV